MKNLVVLFFLYVHTFFGQITVVDWSTIRSGCVGTVNTSNTPNAVVTISGTNLTNVGRPATATSPAGSCSTSSPYYLTATGGANWNMTGLGLAVDWANATSNVVIDVVFTVPVCADLSFILHDLNGDSGSFPFEDKITVVGYDQNSTPIPITAANYLWSTCGGGDCSGATMAVGGAGGAGQSNMRIGRGTNGCFGTNVYGCSSNRVTFTLKSPIAPRKIKRVTITYSCAKNAPDVNAYFTGSNPAFQNIVISNITAIAPPTVSIATPVCNTNSTTVNLIGSASGTISPTYAWSTSTGTINSGSGLLTANVKSPGTFTLTATNNTGCSNTATVALTPLLCNLLPIELTKFTSSRNANTVNIEWQTTIEKNNDYFILERSIDGINFNEIQKIKAIGNASKSTNYFAIDENPSSEVSYYRLTQVDFNGQYKQSNIVSIDDDNSRVSVSQISPNPTSSNIDFMFFAPIKGELSYDIIDLTGRVLISNKEIIDAGKSKQTVYLEELPHGIYFLKVNFERSNFVSTSKIFKN
jgi:hypothetical protein